MKKKSLQINANAIGCSHIDRKKIEKYLSLKINIRLFCAADGIVEKKPSRANTEYFVYLQSISLIFTIISFFLCSTHVHFRSLRHSLANGKCMRFGYIQINWQSNQFLCLIELFFIPSLSLCLSVYLSNSPLTLNPFFFFFFGSKWPVETLKMFWDFSHFHILTECISFSYHVILPMGSDQVQKKGDSIKYILRVCLVLDDYSFPHPLVTFPSSANNVFGFDLVVLCGTPNKQQQHQNITTIKPNKYVENKSKLRFFGNGWHKMENLFKDSLFFLNNVSFDIHEFVFKHFLYNLIKCSRRIDVKVCFNTMKIPEGIYFVTFNLFIKASNNIK